MNVYTYVDVFLCTLNEFNHNYNRSDIECFTFLQRIGIRKLYGSERKKKKQINVF